MPEETKEKKKELEAKLVEVPTATALAFELESGEIVSSEVLLVRIYNLLRKLERGLL